MMILDCVELPYPPSVNHYWEACVYKKRGKLVRGRRKSEKALQFIEAMKLLVRRKNAVIGRVGVLLRVFFPDNRVRDLDNLLKGVLDGLVAAGVMLDDSSVRQHQTIAPQGIRHIRQHNAHTYMHLHACAHTPSHTKYRCRMCRMCRIHT